ncbi:uncharacterized protein LOC142319864 [Lycorma delicatula]
MRLVLRQPSPIWRVFHVEEINLYVDLPRLTAKNSLNNSSGTTTTEQYDKLLALIRRQTLAALNWTPSDSKSASSRIPIQDQQKGSCGYEITKLPQIFKTVNRYVEILERLQKRVAHVGHVAQLLMVGETNHQSQLDAAS